MERERDRGWMKKASFHYCMVHLPLENQRHLSVGPPTLLLICLKQLDRILTLRSFNIRVGVSFWIPISILISVLFVDVTFISVGPLTTRQKLDRFSSSKPSRAWITTPEKLSTCPFDGPCCSPDGPFWPTTPSASRISSTI